MQIVCSKAELLKGIQIVQSAVSTKSTLPVLSNILLETKTNQLKLASTDLEVGVRCLIKAEVVKVATPREVWSSRAQSHSSSRLRPRIASSRSADSRGSGSGVPSG